MRLLLALACSAAALAAEPIRLHPENPHYFLFRGRPAVLVSSGEHYGAVLNLEFDNRKYLDALRNDGLNYTRVFSGSYVEAPGAFGIKRNDLAPAAGKFLAPWLRSGTAGYRNGGNKFDLEQWNMAYFGRLRDFLAEAGKRGIVVEMTLFSSHYADTNWALSAFNPANNVNGTTSIDRRKLHTLDNGNILGYQERLVRKIVRELNGFDNLTYEIQNETGFIGRDDSTYRKQAWNFMLAGGGLFNSLDYSFTVGHEDGTDTAPNGPGGGSPALRRQLALLIDVMHSLDLVNLRPDPHVVRSAPGVYTQVLAAPGKEYLVYMTGSGPCRLVLELAPGEYTADWINPRTGDIEKTDKLGQQGGAVVVPTPVFEDDIVLVIRNAHRLMER